MLISFGWAAAIVVGAAVAGGAFLGVARQRRLDGSPRP